MNNSGVASQQGSFHSVNQDSCAAYPELKLWVLADGMSGQGNDPDSGATAAGLACALIVQGVQEGAELIEALERAHETLLATEEVQSDPGAGACAVALRLYAESGADGAYGEVAWVGDARAYAWDGETLWLLTQDHTLDEAADQDAEGADPHKFVLTHALGVDAPSDLDIGYLQGPLPANGVFLLCSDGVSDVLSGDEIANLLQAEESVHRVAASIVRAARAKGIPDDISAIVIRA